ncbi:MAG: tyrosine--tRNA ligase [Saprospiraceae bacterium]|nr:tyrosine--tRNA ligase [Saprospiraceae bacterium]
MNFLDELSWRGMLYDATPGIRELLDQGTQTAYIGFDPTAPSLTIGNYVQIMLLKLFQLSGHRPIVLMGGATGRIGDPSGKDAERELKSYEELDENLQRQIEQFRKFLDFDDSAKGETALLLNNLDFYSDMNVLEFLRLVGKTLTVNYMMSKESVKKRIDTGISFTEFSYQLLQAYDFQCLYQQEGCRIQMGGSDQWGNITSGTEFIRRNLSAKAYAITTPLLTKSDGSKFGKSEEGNIWLDPDMTSPYKFYQFWINCDDADIPKFTRFFTLQSKEDIESRERDLADNPREQKRLLAEELTRRIHSDEDYRSVLKVSELLFNRRAKRQTLLDMEAGELATVAREIPSFTIPREALAGGVNIVDLLAEKTSIVDSKGEARRAIKGNAISVNKEKIKTHEATVKRDQLLHDRYLMVENGKKNKFILIAN